MCTKNQLNAIISRVVDFSKKAFGDKFQNVILYGSYARGDYDAESDIDIMVMVNMSREELVAYKPSLSQFCAELDLEYGVVLSVKLQSKSFFDQWVGALPFYQNVLKDGVMYA